MHPLGSRTAQTRSVFATEDERLSAHVLRCAAATGVAIEELESVSAVRAAWQHAPVVVIDAAMAERLVVAGLPRRDGVVVVTAEQPGQRCWSTALALGARLLATLPAEEAALTSVLADTTEGHLVGAGKVIAVLGGRGGAGASVFSCAVAAAAARRDKKDALLLDCDPLGGGLDVLTGLDAATGMRWSDIRLAGGRVGTDSLRSALPSRAVGEARVSVLAGAEDGPPIPEQSVGAVLEAGVRGGDTVVCDLGRQAASFARACLERADLCVVLIPAESHACAAARRTVDAAREAGVAPQAVVRGPSPGNLRPAEVAEAAGVPLLVAMRPECSVPVTAESGRMLRHGKGPLRTAALMVVHAAESGAESVSAA